MWTPHQRGEAALAIYAAAEADRRAQPHRYLLDPASVVEAVQARGGFAADDDGDWREGLDVYLASARDEGRLNALGLRNVASTAAGKLIARRAIAEALRAAPEIRRLRVDRPLFVIGGWRTGSTLLQRILAGSSEPSSLSSAATVVATSDAAVGVDEGQLDHLRSIGTDPQSIPQHLQV